MARATDILEVVGAEVEVREKAEGCCHTDGGVAMLCSDGGTKVERAVDLRPPRPLLTIPFPHRHVPPPAGHAGHSHECTERVQLTGGTIHPVVNDHKGMSPPVLPMNAPSASFLPWGTEGHTQRIHSKDQRVL
jgi:hypothetical protein